VRKQLTSLGLHLLLYELEIAGFVVRINKWRCIVAWLTPCRDPLNNFTQFSNSSWR
jgi:hypothetical protein